MPTTITTREQLLSILDVLASGVTVQAALGKHVYANNVARSIIGLGRRADITTLTPERVTEILEIYGEDNKILASEQMPGRRAVAAKGSIEQIMSFRKNSGSKVNWTRVKSSPIFDDTGNVELVVNVMQDITDLKQTESRLHEINAEVTSLLRDVQL